MIKRSRHSAISDISKAKSTPSKIVITTGDRDGIGLEVTCKALAKIGQQTGARFLMTAHATGFGEFKKSATYRRLDRTFNIIELPVSSLDFAVEAMADLDANELAVFVDSHRQVKTEACWVLAAAKLAQERKISAIVTGPVSKDRFKALSSRYMGHTAVLAKVSGQCIYQGYIGPKMAVVLATDHVALGNVEKVLTAKKLRGAAEAVLQLRALLEPKRRSRPVAWLGLNPHAGENGLIGQFERQALSRKMIPRSFGTPLPADTAFSQAKLRATSVYLSLYHDQGLIPFKMLHGQDSGFQISLGLPFIRTSVDHGTAKDLFGKGLANPGSMIDAIKAALMSAKRAKSLR